MGSCFKFNLGRKRGYNFNNEPYQAAAPVSGTYRHSAVVEVDVTDKELEDVDIVDIKEASVINGKDGTVKDVNVNDVSEIVNGHDDPPTVVSCPSNADVTFGEKFQDAEEIEQELKGKKDKKDKKSKKDKSKKKNKKDKKKKKEEIKEAAVVVVAEEGGDEKGAEEEGGDKDANGSPSGGADDGVGDMETLPREDRYALGMQAAGDVSGSSVTDALTGEGAENGVGEGECGDTAETVATTPREQEIAPGPHNGDEEQVLEPPPPTDTPEVVTPRSAASDHHSDFLIVTPLQEEEVLDSTQEEDERTPSAERCVTPTPEVRQEPEVSERTEDARASRSADDEDATSTTETEVKVTEMKVTEVSSEVESANPPVN